MNSSIGTTPAICNSKSLQQMVRSDESEIAEKQQKTNDIVVDRSTDRSITLWTDQDIS